MKHDIPIIIVALLAIITAVMLNGGSVISFIQWLGY